MNLIIVVILILVVVCMYMGWILLVLLSYLLEYKLFKILERVIGNLVSMLWWVDIFSIIVKGYEC